MWPEQTMEAYDASTAAGNPFVEVDCWMLAGGQGIALMHDASVTRTTDGNQMISDLSASDWGSVKINGRKLLGSKWGKYHAPFLDEVLVRFRNERILVVEAKGGQTGNAIVQKLKFYHIDKDYVLVNAIQEAELRAARAAGYKTCLNLLDMSHSPKSLKSTGYWAVLCPAKVTQAYISALKAAGLKVLGPPVNRHFERDKLLGLGMDGIYTDDPVYLDVKWLPALTDPFAKQTFAPGMLAVEYADRGYFVPPDKWVIDSSKGSVYRGCLQGWMCPIGNSAVAPEWSMEVSITFGSGSESSRWAGVAILTNDEALNSDAAPKFSIKGYNFFLRNTGELSITRYDGAIYGAPVDIANARGPEISDNETVRLRIVVGPERIALERVDGKAAVSVEDKAYRGAYATFGAKGMKAAFSKVVVSSKQ